MTDHAQMAREIVSHFKISIKNAEGGMILEFNQDGMTSLVEDALTQAHTQGRRETLDECADLIEVQELADPSGLSRKEQLRIYDIIQKLADMCRAQAKEAG